MYGVKPSRKFLLYIGVILIIALLIFAGLFYYFSNKNTIIKKTGEKTTQESILESISAPNSNSTAEPISEEIIEGLSAPSSNQKQEKISEDLLKSLSAPETK